MKTGLKVLDGYLTQHTFLVGDHITLADIIAWSNLVMGFKQVLTSHMLSSRHSRDIKGDNCELRHGLALT